MGPRGQSARSSWIAGSPSLVLALVLVASLAVAAPAPADARGQSAAVHVKTKAKFRNLGVASAPESESSFLSGRVKARRGSREARRLCERRRRVEVTGLGKARTSRRGRFELELPDPAPAGKLRAKVKRKTIGRGGERIVCRKGSSRKARLPVLGRPADPVVVSGERVSALAGSAPGKIAAFRFDPFARRWEQIPVQIDERHVVDFRTIHGNTREHSLTSLEYADPGTLSGPDSDPTLDADDEVVFMARDALGRAPAGTPAPPGVRPRSGQAVRIGDPLERKAAAWVYLFRHDGRLDPAAGRDYVDYDFNLLAGEYPANWRFEPNHGDPIGNPPQNPTPPTNPEDSRVSTPFYSEHFAAVWITDELRIEAGDATGVDILDRNRLGVPFVGDQANVVCPRTENTFAAGHGAYVASIDGPVRAIRDYIGANSGIYTQRRQVFYERREDLTVFLRLHPVENNLVDLLDYNAAAIGMSYRNNLMGTAPAVTIDGNPDSVPTGALSWELAKGPQGSLVAAHAVDTDIPGYQPTSIYVDDATPEALPCTGDGQALGTSGSSTSLAGTPRTDPTPRGDPQNQGLPVYRFTSYRTHFYEPPGTTADTAARRSSQARTPLTAKVKPRD